MFFYASPKAKKLLFSAFACYAFFAYALLQESEWIDALFLFGQKLTREVVAAQAGYSGNIKAVQAFTERRADAREVHFTVASRENARRRGLLNMKKFKTGNYSHVYLLFPGDINYVDPDTGEVREINNSFLAQADGTHTVTEASYRAQAPAFADETLTVTVDGVDVNFRALEVGTTTVSHVPGILTGANTITYADAFGSGIDYVIEAEPDELRKLVVFHSAPVTDIDTHIRFETSLRERATLRGRNTNIGVFFFRKPAVWDSGNNRDEIIVELENSVMTKILPAEFFEKISIQYPVFTDVTTSYYAGAGDGYVESSPDNNWAGPHDATSGGTANYTGTTARTGFLNDGSFTIRRAFTPVDTSGIADSDEITAARLKIYATAKTNDLNDGTDWVNVVQTTQASTSQLITDDYDQCGSVSNPTEGATRIDITAITTGAYNTFTLNSTGQTWISKTSFTKLGLREGHDALNTEPGTGTEDVTFSTSETAGTTQDPVLEVDTTAANIDSVTTQRTIFATSSANVIATSQMTGETNGSTTLEYVFYFDTDGDNAPDTNETYVTGDCAGSGLWSSGKYTFVKSGFTIAEGASPKTHTWECSNSSFPENGLYSMYLTWKDANGTIDTHGTGEFQSCDQPTGTNSWWDTSYANRVLINFRSATFSEALINFPALVKATSTNFGFDDPDSSANDVRFIDGIDDGQTTLDYEREFYDSTTTKEGYWWVEVPKIATSTDCDYIQMYYDNAGAAGTSSSTAPWRQDYYEAVWHFGETVTTTSYNFQEGVSPNSSYTGGEGVMIGDGSPTTNLLNKTAFQVDYLTTICGGTDKICRTLQQWDISTISSCTVASASVTINVSNATADRYSVYALRRNWGETTVTWNTYDGTNSWTTAGASSTVSDFYNTDLMDGNSDSGWGSASTGSVTHSFDSDGVSTIQDWINGTVTNNGVIIRDTVNNGTVDDDGYAWATTTDATTANRPKLTINCGTNDVYLDSTLNDHDETNSTVASRNEKGQSKFGYSPKLAGAAGDGIGIPDSAGFDVTSYTLTGWFRRDGTGDPATFSLSQQLEPFISKGRGEADTQAADIQFSVGYNRVGQATLGANWEDDRHASGNDWSHLGGTTIANSVWKHFGFRLKDKAIANLYLDGFVNNTTTYPINQGASTGGTMKLGIGTNYNTSGTADGGWLGYLDEIRVYKVAIATTTASNDSAWLRAEWFTADNGFVEWGTESTTTAALAVTASTTLSFSSVSYSFSNQSSTATDVGGVKVDGVGNWTLNISCQDNSSNCTWYGQTQRDRFLLHGDMSPGGSVPSSSGLFCDFSSQRTCTSTSGDTCSTVTLSTGYKCFPTSKADITIATGSSADGTFWFAEADWQIGIPARVSASLYTTTLTFDLQ